MNISSKLLDNTIQELATLPGIGKKTALRLALHLLQQDPLKTQEFYFVNLTNTVKIV